MKAKVRNVIFTLCGAAGLLLKGQYRGPFREAIRGYCGNFAVSFAVYFLLANVPLCRKKGRLPLAGCALAVVSLFEATDGFGLMANTYDPLDYAANAAGIALAVWVDAAASKAEGRPRPENR